MQGVHYALLAADPTPLTPDFFTRRVEEINATVSAQLYDALKISGLLDEHGYLPRDPRCAAVFCCTAPVPSNV